MTTLLDVNVLISLVDPAHSHHELAHDWFTEVRDQGWATCSITEIGVVRVLSHPRYPNAMGTPGEVIELLRRLRAVRGHEFWTDDVSPADPSRCDRRRLLSHGQITDIHLLALAVANGGEFATFDRRLVADAVPGGLDALVVIG